MVVKSCGLDLQVLHGQLLVEPLLPLSGPMPPDLHSCKPLLA